MALALLVAPAQASLIVPVGDDDLIAGADVIVLGRVSGIESHQDVTGDISTYVTVAIDEVLKGMLPGSEVTLRELGGKVGDRMAWVFANPQYEVGERALLFMDQRPDGELRTYQFFMGKFTIVTDPASGDLVAMRGLPRHVAVLRPRGAASVAAPPAAIGRALDDFTRRIREKAGEPRPPASRPRPVLPFASALVPPAGTVESHREFRFLDDPDPPGAVDPGASLFRWNEADSNEPVTMRIYADGEPLAPTFGFDQIRAAMRAWNRVPTSAFRFAEGEMITTPGLGGFRVNGVNAIAFRDPRNQIAPPVNCRGTLAIAGIPSVTLSGGTPVNGRTFFGALEGDVVVADGWGGCGTYFENFANFAEVMTHELGHVLGLGHSAATGSDPVNLGPGRAGATMEAFANFDGRGAALHADDRAGVTFIYPARTLTIVNGGPGSGTVTSGTDGIDCGSDCVAGFAPGSNVTLSATPSGVSTFAGYLEAGCGPTVVMTVNRTCTAVFTTDPDLLMAAVSSPTVAAPGSNVTITNTVRNIGLDAGPFDVGIYLSNTSTISTMSQLLATRRVAGDLAFSQTSTDATLVSIPADVPPGTYFIGAIADTGEEVSEAVESNNARTAVTSIVIARPDLVVTALTAPAIAGTGLPIAANTTVKNQVTVDIAAPASTLAFYLSTDAVLDGDDRRLSATRLVPGLNRNATSAGTTTLTVPADLAPGAYFVIARADDVEALDEQSESNNTLATAAPLTVRRPDLAVTSLTAPAVTGPGMNVTVTHVVRNVAAAPATAGPSTSRLFLSADGTLDLDGTDRQLGADVPVGPLAAGAQATLTRIVQVSSDTPAGVYRVFARANALNSVIEADSPEQANDTRVAMTTIVVGADLLVTAATPVPLATAPGLSVNVTSSARNQGGQAAGAFDVSIYLSTDSLFGGGDILLATRRVTAGLAPGATSTAVTPAPIPADTPAATYFLLVRADAVGSAPGEVSEANESNNERASVAIRVVKADLSVTSVTATPAAIVAGGNVTVTHIVRNAALAAGGAPAATSRLFLSSDATLDGGDLQLGGDIAVGALAGGAQASLRRSVQIPPATVPGRYWILAQANATGAVQEADSPPVGTQGNNVKSTATPLIVGPDLLVSAGTATPTATAPGLAVNVSSTVRNQGGQAAGAFDVAVYLSADNQYDDGVDEFLNGRRVTAGLMPGAVSTAATPVIIPGTTSAGSWFLIVRVDSAGAAPGEVTEGNEDNNTRVVPLTVARPDLTVTSVTAPAVAAPGANVSVTHVVRNVALKAGAAPATVSRLFLSSDGMLDGADVQLGGDVPVGPLAGMVQAAVRRSVQIPLDTPPGLYRIFASANANGAVVEADGGNNHLATAAPITIGPDVAVTAASTATGTIPGAGLNVSYTIRNFGSATGPFDVGFALVPATTPGPDIPIGPTRTAVVLAQNGTLAAASPVTVPAGVPPGQYRVRVIADVEGRLVEAVAANNTRTTGILTVTPPDLSVSSLGVPGVGVAGRRIGIPNSVRNNAAAPGTARAFQIGLYVADSADVDPQADALLTARSLASLAPGATSTATTMVTLPTTTGSYFIGAVADRAGTVVESNEGNNILAGAITVVPEMVRSRPATAPITLSSCIVAQNNSSSTLGGTLGITRQTGTAWSGTARLTSGPQVNTITVTGTVDVAGSIDGTFTIVNSAGPRGSGTFSGAVVPTPGGSFVASFSGAFTSGEACTISGSLSAP